jgi:hypothetical protein
MVAYLSPEAASVIREQAARIAVLEAEVAEAKRIEHQTFQDAAQINVENDKLRAVENVDTCQEGEVVTVKTGGYRAFGIILSVFTKLDGHTQRCVVEYLVPPGLLHIHNLDQCKIISANEVEALRKEYEYRCRSIDGTS